MSNKLDDETQVLEAFGLVACSISLYQNLKKNCCCSLALLNWCVCFRGLGCRLESWYVCRRKSLARSCLFVFLCLWLCSIVGCYIIISRFGNSYIHNIGSSKLTSDILLLLLSCQTKSYRNFCLIRVWSGTKFLLSFTLFIYFNLKI